MVGKITTQGRIRLDKAIERSLASVADAPTAVELQGFADAIAQRQFRAEVLLPQGISEALFAYLMPHVSNPAIFHPERRQSLLRRLEARALSRAEGAPVVPGGLDSLRMELQNLETLHRQRHSLIGG